jgi:hypothetical protein
MFYLKLGKVFFSFFLATLMFLSFPLATLAKAEDIDITFKKTQAKGYLKKKYIPYEFTFHNKTSNDINITDIDFSSDQPVDLATQDARSVSQGALGATWALAGLLWFTLIVPAYAIIATPVILIRRSTTRAKTSKELEEFSELKPRNLKISANQSEKIVVIFPKDFTRTDLTFNYQSSSFGTRSYSEKIILSERE